MEIKGSVVLVTGGGNGIGESVAKYFAKQGAKVAIVDMVQKNIDRVVAELKAMGAEAIGIQANVTSEAETAKFVNATVAKVASGAAETVPYFMVTNLARTLGELKERNIWIIGTSDTATQTLYQADLTGPVALVLGAEGAGMRQLTSKTCDQLVSIPMRGAVESLNV